MYRELLNKRENMLERNGMLIPLTQGEFSKLISLYEGVWGKDMLESYSRYFDKDSDDYDILEIIMSNQDYCAAFFSAFFDIANEYLTADPFVKEIQAMINDFRDDLLESEE